MVRPGGSAPDREQGYQREHPQEYLAEHREEHLHAHRPGYQEEYRQLHQEEQEQGGEQEEGPTLLPLDRTLESMPPISWPGLREVRPRGEGRSGDSPSGGDVVQGEGQGVKEETLPAAGKTLSSGAPRW